MAIAKYRERATIDCPLSNSRIVEILRLCMEDGNSEFVMIRHDLGLMKWHLKGEPFNQAIELTNTLELDKVIKSLKERINYRKNIRS